MYSLKHPLKDRWVAQSADQGAYWTATAAGRLTYSTPALAESYRRLFEQALDLGLVVQNLDTGALVLPPYDEDARKFREAWSALYPATTPEDFLALDNCAGLKFLARDESEASFFCGPLDFSCDHLAVNAQLHPGEDAEDEPALRLEVFKEYDDHGDEWIETFTDTDEFIAWLHDHLE